MEMDKSRGETIALRSGIALLCKFMRFLEWRTIGWAGIALLVSCSNPGEEIGFGSEELRFEINRIDKATLTAEAKVLAAGSSAEERLPQSGETIRLLLSRGDAAYLEAGDVCRAKLGNSIREGVFQVEDVWPDGPGLREGLDQANANLRSEVERRGENGAREVGAILPKFAVIDQDGEVIDASFLKGKTTVINFFFTRCSKIAMCPTTTRRLNVMLEKAPKSGLTNLQVLSLSFDPEHDTPGVLKDYAQAYQLDETSFRLGTGSKQVLDDLRHQLGISTRKDPKLVIDHTFRAVVVDERLRIMMEIPGPVWSVDNTLARLRSLRQERVE